MDESLRRSLRSKIDNLNKPLASMGRLEELAMQIGLVQGTLSPALIRPRHILLAADHGIEREGVSASPREVTWQQMRNFACGGGGVNMLCRQHGVELTLVDCGVDHDLSDVPEIRQCKVMPRGTHNFLHAPAMPADAARQCLALGAALADEVADGGSTVVSVGEMGIGNTSPSSLWMHLLLGLPLADCVGRGSGLSDAMVDRKREVLRQCLRRASPTDPQDVMRQFGGLEMVTAVGLMMRAAERGLVVMVDGFIMTACALMASRLSKGFMPHAVFCHQGDEAGHRAMLRAMGARGLLDLGLRLGEGTGALCAYPLLDSAVRMINEMNNFKDASITKYF